MAKYEIQPTVVLQNENHLQRYWKSRTEFEPILVQKQFFTETKWNFRFRTADG
jgi:hypothetical protein